MGYPKAGQPLVPALLLYVFDVPIPGWLIGPSVPANAHLIDIDGAALDQLEPMARERLVDFVVQRARTSWVSWPEPLLTMPLDVPRGVDLEDLELGTRVFNALRREGLDVNLQHLADYCMKDLMKIHAFGAACLLEVLWALEWVAARVASDGSEHTRASSGHDNAVASLDVWMNGGTMPASGAFVRAAKNGVLLEAGHEGLRIVAAVRDQLAEMQRIHEVAASLLAREDLEMVTFTDRRLGESVDALSMATGADGALLEVLQVACADGCDSPGQRRRALGALLQLDEKISHASTLTLEQELDEIMFASSRRSKAMYLRRIGWDQDKRPTLEAVGEHYRLTRERVRQICALVTKPLEGTHPYAPALDHCLAEVARLAPTTRDDAEAHLGVFALAPTGVRLHALVEIAGKLGRDELGFVIDGPLVLPEHVGGSGSSGSGVLRAARKAVSHWGVTTFSDVAASVEMDVDEDEAQQLVRTIVQEDPNFCLLDEESGWFFFRDGYNALLARLRKILAVASPIHLSELRAGLGRHYRTRGFAPPKRVLAALCSEVEGYRCEGSLVIAEPQPDWRDVVSGVEATMVATLMANGRVMPRDEFERACVGVGVNKSTFYVYLDNSPLLCRLARGVYGLRGTDVQPGVVERLAPKRKLRRVRIDHGWAKDGGLWIAYRLSTGMISSGVFGVPTSLGSMLGSTYVLEASDGAVVGKVTVPSDGGSAWSLGPLFRRRGGEPGDVLLLTFNLQDKTVIAEIGDDGLIPGGI